MKRNNVEEMSNDLKELPITNKCLYWDHELGRWIDRRNSVEWARNKKKYRDVAILDDYFVEWDFETLQDDIIKKGQRLYEIIKEYFDFINDDDDLLPA